MIVRIIDTLSGKVLKLRRVVREIITGCYVDNILNYCFLFNKGLILVLPLLFGLATRIVSDKQLADLKFNFNFWFKENYTWCWRILMDSRMLKTYGPIQNLKVKAHVSLLAIPATSVRHLLLLMGPPT
jgi:hypothetical protein